MPKNYKPTNKLIKEKIPSLGKTVTFCWLRFPLKLEWHLQKNCSICFSESPLKLMKKAFNFIIQASFALTVFKFLSRLFGLIKNFLKKLYCPFLWMEFNCFKARDTSRRQFTFYRPWKDERLSQPWSHPVDLNTRPLDSQIQHLNHWAIAPIRLD